MIGEKLEPILLEIEDTLLDFEVLAPGMRPCFSETAFRAILKMFMSAMLDKMYEMQVDDKMDFEDMKAMAVKCGEDLKKIVHTYTGIDTKQLYK